MPQRRPSGRRQGASIDRREGVAAAG